MHVGADLRTIVVLNRAEQRHRFVVLDYRTVDQVGRLHAVAVAEFLESLDTADVLHGVAGPPVPASPEAFFFGVDGDDEARVHFAVANDGPATTRSRRRSISSPV